MNQQQQVSVPAAAANLDNAQSVEEVKSRLAASQQLYGLAPLELPPVSFDLLETTRPPSPNSQLRERRETQALLYASASREQKMPALEPDPDSKASSAPMDVDYPDILGLVRLGYDSNSELYSSRSSFSTSGQTNSYVSSSSSNSGGDSVPSANQSAFSVPAPQSASQSAFSFNAVPSQNRTPTFRELAERHDISDERKQKRKADKAGLPHQYYDAVRELSTTERNAMSNLQEQTQRLLQAAKKRDAVTLEEITKEGCKALNALAYFPHVSNWGVSTIRGTIRKKGRMNFGEYVQRDKDALALCDLIIIAFEELDALKKLTIGLCKTAKQSKEASDRFYCELNDAPKYNPDAAKNRIESSKKQKLEKKMQRAEERLAAARAAAYGDN